LSISVPLANSVFLPQRLSPSPLALARSVTQAADLSWVAVGFERPFQISYSRTHDGTGWQFPDLLAPCGVYDAGGRSAVSFGDSQTPQAQGTGTEEWGGGDY